MEAITFSLCVLFLGTVLDWIFRSEMLRRSMYVVLTAIGITTCSQLGTREVLHLDGGMWSMLLTLAGLRLLFKRWNYSRTHED
jgi:hypothetical protein